MVLFSGTGVVVCLPSLNGLLDPRFVDVQAKVWMLRPGCQVLASGMPLLGHCWGYLTKGY